jgi:hypothetical protein
VFDGQDRLAEDAVPTGARAAYSLLGIVGVITEGPSRQLITFLTR